MKGIIIVDKPDTCMDCEFCRELDEGINAFCIMKTEEVMNDMKCAEDLYKTIDCDHCQEIPKWCPIKALPKSITTSFE